MVLSTRYRLARNLTGFPFPARAHPASSEQVRDMLQRAVQHEFPHWRIDLARDISPVMRELFFEMHLASSQIKTHPNHAMLCTSPDARVVLLVNEEDHIRLQLLLPGYQMMDSWRELLNLESRLERWLDFAYHPQYGYLTSCLTNVGTGLRASVMLHMAASSWLGALQSAVGNWPDAGIEFRGIFGEGSSMESSFLQASNKITLGADVEAINARVAATVDRLISMEFTCREELLTRRRVALEDSVHRAFGTLRSARLMTSEEATSHLSMIRLGACLGILPGFPPAEVLRLLVSIRPAHLQVVEQGILQAPERDQRRADYLRSQIEKFVEVRDDG